MGGVIGALILGALVEIDDNSCSGYYCIDIGATGIVVGAAVGFLGGGMMGGFMASGKKSYSIQGNQGVYEARKLELERYVYSLRQGKQPLRSFK